MRSYLVQLVQNVGCEGSERVIEEKKVTGKSGWIKDYMGIVKEYKGKMSTNEDLEIKVSAFYE